MEVPSTYVFLYCKNMVYSMLYSPGVIYAWYIMDNIGCHLIKV